LHIRENARKHHRERQPAKTLERGSEQTTTTSDETGGERSFKTKTKRNTELMTEASLKANACGNP
jgi:hypothetical protein